MTSPSFSHNLPMAKLPTSQIYLASEYSPSPSYEWFYFEAFTSEMPHSQGQQSRSENAKQRHHMVLILSLRDPFFGERPSAYLTWHTNGKIAEYAYNLFADQAELIFKKNTLDFLMGIKNTLQINLVSHSTSHVIAVSLNRNNLPNGLNLKKTSSYPTACNSQNFSPDEYVQKHFWQPLLHGAEANFSITLNRKILSKENLSNRVRNKSLSENNGACHSFKRSSLFFDVPLANFLKNHKKNHSVTFGTKPEQGNTQADQTETQFYCDHNFGFEPLSCLKEHWFWWHVMLDSAKTENTLPYSEIGYYFPTKKQGYLCTNPNNLSETVPFQHLPIVTMGTSYFGVPTVKNLRLQNGTLISFRNKIESAPFYTRCGIESATLETLFPARLRWPGCRQLMNARVVKVFCIPPTGPSLLFSSLCKKVTQKYGRSFYLASKILSPTQQHRAYFVYLLCRFIDDATDEGIGDGSKASLRFVRSLFAQKEIPEEENMTFLGATLSSLVGYAFGKSAVHIIYKEIRESITQLALNEEHFNELIEGQRSDEEFSQPENFADLYNYCFRVAGVVGLMMAKVLGVPENSKALQAAEHLGIAMQITNILRDLREDYKRLGRVYVPKDFCAANNINFCKLFSDTLTPQNQDNPNPEESIPPNAAAEKIVGHFGNLAMQYYSSALQGISHIPSRRGRLCVKLMAAIYGRILGEIQNKPQMLLHRRVVVPKKMRIWVFIRVLFGVSPLRAAKLVERNRIA